MAVSLGKTTASNIAPEDARAVLSLQMLIARAANKDSLAWWDDESLTRHAEFVLERVFPIAPALAARSLALSAAAARHDAAFAGRDGVLHLYRLDPDGQDTLALRSASLLDIPVRQEPIPSIDALRRELLDLLGEPVSYTSVRRSEAGGLQIAVPAAPAGMSPVLHRARTLAWAYLEGAPNAPVFPYCVERP